MVLFNFYQDRLSAWQNMQDTPLPPNSAEQIKAFLVETGKNEAMLNENMDSRTVEELVAVANRYGFRFSPADMIRHQAQTILSFNDEELSLYYQSQSWWQLCLEAYGRYGRWCKLEVRGHAKTSFSVLVDVKGGI